jgi:vacuolar-type H+-ATPase subunit F/Vma7
MKYCIIGDENALLGFEMIGVEGYHVHNAKECAQAFDNALQDKEIAIILIVDNVAPWIREKIEKYIFTHDFPLICEIPGLDGRDPNRVSLRDLANQAIGVKL